VLHAFTQNHIIVRSKDEKVTVLGNAIRSAILGRTDVSRLTGLRRGTVLYSATQAADSVYFIETGLVKLTRMNNDGGRIILEICGAGDLVGDESLAGEQAVYQAEAEVLSTASIARISGDGFLRAAIPQPDFVRTLVAYILQRKTVLAQKAELLCLRGVEYRILFYLAELAELVKESADGSGYQLPLTQLELADLIGATRETTSTTLNQLERRGLIRLSRRLLTVPSPALLREAAAGKMPPRDDPPSVAIQPSE
jgi:CRP-like cAMP-binding protein